MSMNTNENTTQQAAIEKRVQAVHQELKQYLQEAQKRSKRVAVVLTLLVIIIAGYGAYMYSQVPNVNAETAADMAYKRAVQYVNAAPPVLSQTLKDKAPEVFDFAEMRILESPVIIAGYIRQAALEKTQIVLNQSEPAITGVITDAILHARNATANAGFDGKDPAQLDKMMQSIANEMRTQMGSEFDKINGQYEQQAAAILGYIDTLAAGKNLDDRQQHIRNVIVSFLAVAEKHKSTP